MLHSYNCSNTVSLFRFPNNPLLRLQWIQQVQRTRKDFNGPMEFSVVCSKHFTRDCFEVDPILAEKFGIEIKASLKPDAVPTVFPRTAVSGESSTTQSSPVTVVITNVEGQCSSRKQPGKEVSIPVEKKKTTYEK